MSDNSSTATFDTSPAKRRPGRPGGVDMVTLSLRISRAHLLALTEESARRTVETGRNVTPQAVIISMIAASLADAPQDAPAA